MEWSDEDIYRISQGVKAGNRLTDCFIAEDFDKELGLVRIYWPDDELSTCGGAFLRVSEAGAYAMEKNVQGVGVGTTLCEGGYYNYLVRTTVEKFLEEKVVDTKTDKLIDDEKVYVFFLSNLEYRLKTLRD